MFGQHQPLYTPFELTHGLPAGWQATETDSVLTNGRLLVWQLGAGPAAKPGALTILRGHPRRDLRGPATAAVHPDDGRDPVGLQLLLRPRRGSGRLRSEGTSMEEYMTMYYYWRGHPQALNLASLLRSTKFFGPDPSGWTTRPIAG